MSKIATPDMKSAYGRRLQTIRLSAELSQARFAASLGVVLRAYGNYERGEREMPASIVKALHEIYAVDPIWLLCGPGFDRVVRRDGHVPKRTTARKDMRGKTTAP
jgi:Predicted transcriptional regulators